MGARTSFLQAMLIGVVVGAALATAYFQLRGDDANLSAARKHTTTELDQLRARVDELERANAALRASAVPLDAGP